MYFMFLVKKIIVSVLYAYIEVYNQLNKQIQTYNDGLLYLHGMSPVYNIYSVFLSDIIQ